MRRRRGWRIALYQRAEVGAERRVVDEGGTSLAVAMRTRGGSRIPAGTATTLFHVDPSVVVVLRESSPHLTYHGRYAPGTTMEVMKRTCGAVLGGPWRVARGLGDCNGEVEGVARGSRRVLWDSG